MLTVKETAKIFGVSDNLVYALVAKKLIRHERYGFGRSVIRIPEQALDEYRRSATCKVNGSNKEAAAITRRVKLKHLSLD